MVHIFYHFDADGYAAAGIIGSMYIKMKETKFDDIRFMSFTDEVKFYLSRHDRPLDLSNIKDNDTVYIVDYSFSREDDQKALEKLLTEYPNIEFIWIDHHKTSNVILSNHPIFVERLKTNGYVLTPTEDSDGTHFNYSGAMLAYFYVVNKLWYEMKHKDHKYYKGYKGTDDFINKDEAYLQNLYDKAPEWIRLVSDHDTWRHEIEGSSEFVKGSTEAGLWKTFCDISDVDSFMCLFYVSIVEPLRKNKKNPRWDLYNMILKNRVTKLVETGSNIFKWEDGRNGRLVKSNGFEASLRIDIPSDYIDPGNKLNLEKDDRGHVVRDALLLCYNGHGNSRTFLDNLEKYDAVVIFSFNGDNFSYSMFSKPDGFQCNIAALYFGKYYGITGGGHDHAAGWSSPDLTFKKNREYIATAERFDGVVKEEGWPELWKQKSDSEEPKKTS